MKVFLSKLRVTARNMMTFWQLPEMEKLVFDQWVSPKNKVLILDYGSLSNIERLAKHGCQVIVASVSEGKVLNARKKLGKYENVYYQKLDNYKELPFKALFFDVAVLDFMSHKFSKKDIIPFLKQIKKITKKNGLVIHMGEGNPAPIMRAIGFLPRLMFLVVSGSAVFFHHNLNKLFKEVGIQVTYRKPFFINNEVIVGKV
jgi:SAM-dependent methyltransferase